MRSLFVAVLCAAIMLPVSAHAAEIYRYHGLKPAIGPESEDGVFQNFTFDGSTVGLMWADADARQHKSKSYSWVRAHVVRRKSDEPFLRVHFAREGYGTNIGIVPMKKIPERLTDPDAVLSFSLRAQVPACVGIRMMEGDGEIWGFGREGLKYDRLCVQPDSGWQRFEIPVGSAAANWFKFVYSGNTDLGNDTRDADLVASLSFELGLEGKDYFKRGEGVVDISNILIGASETPVTASAGTADEQ